jgi:hypothetical protein
VRKSGLAVMVVVLGTMLGGASAAGAEVQKCSREQAIKAEMEASTLKTWSEILTAFQRYGHCDDAAISEGYSSSVATLLADRWNGVAELDRLSRANTGFRAFVLRHLDGTMSAEQDKTIQENVRSRCPQGATKLCEAIKARFAELDQPG